MDDQQQQQHNRTIAVELRWMPVGELWNPGECSQSGAELCPPPPDGMRHICRTHSTTTGHFTREIILLLFLSLLSRKGLVWLVIFLHYTHFHIAHFSISPTPFPFLHNPIKYLLSKDDFIWKL